MIVQSYRWYYTGDEYCSTIFSVLSIAKYINDGSMKRKYFYNRVIRI